MYAPKLCLLAILLTVITFSSSADVIHIRVVDGRNGKVIPNEHVQVWINGKTGKALDLKTGADGIIELDVPGGLQ